MAIPKIRMRGIRASIPPGFILGRVGSGRGEVQLLGLSDLTKAGVATTSAVAAAVPIIADGDLLANTSGAAAQPIATTLTALLDYVFTNVEGGILYRGASAWVALAKGTSGYILTQGASDPSWQPAPSSGGTVTSVVAGAGLTGGTITTTGTIALSIPVSIANGGTASTSAAAAVSALGAAGVGVANTFTASNVFQALTYVSRFAGASPTASSQAILSVSGDSGAQSSELYVYGATPQYRTYQAGGSHTALTTTTSGTDLADYDFYGYNGGTSAYAQGARVAAQATESWTTGKQGTKLYFQTTPTATTSLSTVLTIDQDGSIVQSTSAGHNLFASPTTVQANLLVIPTSGAANLYLESNTGSTSTLETASSTGTNTYSFGKYRGTLASPTVVAQYDNMGVFQFTAYSGSGLVAAAGIVANIIEPTPSATAMGSSIFFTYVPIGSVTTTIGLQISSNGFAINGTVVVTNGGSLKAPVSLVSALPSAATEGNGAMRIVTDAIAPALGQTVTGGGSVRVIVNSDGTNWRA